MKHCKRNFFDSSIHHFYMKKHPTGLTVEPHFPTVETEMKKSKFRVKMKGGQTDYILLKDAIRIGENVNRIHIYTLIQLAAMVRQMRYEQFNFLHVHQANYEKMRNMEKMVDNILSNIPDLSCHTALTQTSIINY